MSEETGTEDLAGRAAEAVRDVLAQAQSRAGEIVSAAEARASELRERAEAEAKSIRERAEADARGQIEAAKRALDELGGTLVAAVSEAVPDARSADTPPTEQPPTEPDSEPEAEPEEEGESPGAPEAPVSPPAEESPTVSQPQNGDDAAERLVAMKLAVEGKDREAVEAELSERFGAADRSALLDDVLSRAARA